MLTSQTGTNKKGFTLVELLIVIFILSLTAGIVMPSLWGSGEDAVQAEAKRIGTTLRYLFDEAVGKKKIYLFKAHLTESTWGFESELESKQFRLKNNIHFRDIVTPSLGTVSAGELTFPLGPMGPEEPVTIHIEKDDFAFTITFNHLNGRAKVHKGYIR